MGVWVYTRLDPFVKCSVIDKTKAIFTYFPCSSLTISYWYFDMKYDVTLESPDKYM